MKKKTPKKPIARKVSSAQSVINSIPSDLKSFDVDLQKYLTVDQAREILKNGLGGALGFPGGGGIGWPNNPYQEPLSDPTTVFKNLRWFLISNYRQVLSEAYVELPLVQTICDVPVDDALRGGVLIKSKQLDENEIRKLHLSLEGDDDIITVGQGGKWTRLFGGGGILVNTEQNPRTPLRVEAISEEKPFELKALDMWELYWANQNTEYDPQTQEEEFDHYNYYGIDMHKSRVLKMKGIIAPSFIRPRLRGWGVSIVETLVRSLNQYLKATDLGFEVLDEFKIDVYRVKNLVNTLLSPGGDQKVNQRFQQTNYTKNYQHAIVMDHEDEYEQKQLSFAGLAEMMQGIRMQVASDMRIPMVKLFGTPATGLGADDESSIEVYNMMIESQVRNKIKRPLVTIVELKCQYLFGFIPDDLEVEFKPLRELSAIDTETVKTQIFTRAFQAKSAGELSTFEFRDICNKANLFPVRLDTNADELNPDDPEIKEMVEEGTNTEPEEDAQTATKKKNSLEFDKASYEADGGDEQYDDRRKPFFENPMFADKDKWSRAKEESKRIFGTYNWKYTLWAYTKAGGKKI